MRVVHVIWSMGVGGAESMLVDILNEQSKSEDVHLLIVNDLVADSLMQNINSKVAIHRTNRKPGSRNIFHVIYANKVLLSVKPDILHFHNHDLIRYFPPILYKKSKSLLTVHTTGVTSRNFPKYDSIVAISESVRNDVKIRSGLEAEVIMNGINTDAIRTKQSVSFRKNFRILQIGRLDHSQKGQDIVLQALYEIIHNRRVEGITVDFVGEGPSRPMLLDMKNRLKVSVNSTFWGTKDRNWIYNHLCNYDLFVQPSRREGFGLTVAEAMAAKVPVLVSNVDGPMEIIENGKYGSYFKSEDVQDLADKILEIRNTLKTEQIMGALNTAREHVCNTYDIKQTAAYYVLHYKKLMDTQ